MWNDLSGEDLAAIRGGHHGESLTMAVITEAYPMPPGVNQPGVPSVAPFYMDPACLFTAVVYNYR